MLLCLVGPTEIPPVKTFKEVANGAWGILSGSNAYRASSDATLFSSSLPVLPHAKRKHELTKLLNFCLVEVLLLVCMHMQ